MSIRKLIFIVVTLTFLLGGSYLLSRKFASMKKEPPRRPAMEMKRFVKAQKVEYNDLTSSLEREGRVVAGSEVMLVSEASGKIEKGNIILKEGEAFKKGDLIAVIYKDEVELALKSRKSNFLTTISTMLPDLKVDYPDAVERFQYFFSEIDMDAPLPELPEIDNDKLKIFLASRKVLSEYYGILQDEKRVERHSMYAPFDGAFLQVNFELGAYVNTGGQIAKMIRTDMMEIEVPVENGQSRWIEIGDKVFIKSRGVKQELKGAVVRKANFIDAKTQSRSIYVRVSSDQGGELLAGDYKTVTFPGQRMEGVIEIPRSAVFNSNEVFIVLNGKLKKQEINILKYNDKSLIINGLNEGVNVVVEPLINVKENSPVGIFGEEEPVKNQRKGKPDKGQRQSS